MTTQLLFYRSAVPVTPTSHGDCHVDIGARYGFSAAANSVPLMAVEFPQAAGDYGIVFGGARGNLIPAAVLGVRTDENLFLAPDGAWDARYLPAFVRRYPFVLSGVGDRLVLCVDETFPGLNREGRGARLFAADGAPTPYTDGILKFLQEYQTQFENTRRFCARLEALDLLEPMQAQVTMPAGETLSMGGFLTVGRARLKALPDAALAEMARSDEMELIHLHLHSLRNLERLGERLARRVGALGAANGAANGAG